MPRYTLRALLILVTVIGCAIGLLRGCYLAITRFETAENIPHVDWLPVTASNISYYRSCSITAYEFDMTEPEFKKWVRWKVEPIIEPVKVHRYALRTRGYPDLSPNLTLAEMEAWEAVGSATITNGLCYSRRSSNGGGVSLAYDRSKGRVFFETSPR